MDPPLVCHLSPCSSMVRMSYWRSQGCGVVHYVVCDLSPCSSMVRMSYWRSQGCGVVHYVVCHLSPCSSMVRMSYWRSQGCGVVHYVVCHLSPCSSMVRTSHCHQKVMGYTLCSLPSAIWVLAAQWLATLMVFISVFLFRDRNTNIFAFTFYQENKPETNS